MGRREAGKTWVIAHRGASADCRENSIAAFDEALRQGCDGIELDLQLSRDGVPVVYHDRTLEAAGRGRDSVAEVDFAQLAEHIPSLEDVLERYATRTRLLLEIKTREGRAGRERQHRLTRAVVRMVQDKSVERNVMVLCFDGEILDICAEEAPGLRRVQNLKPPPLLTSSLRRRASTLWALSVDVRTLTSTFAASARRHGIRLLAFTCNTERQVASALAANAAGIMSDRPAWLAEQLRNRAPSDEA